MDGLFEELEDEDAFVKFVTEQYEAVPPAIRSVMWCKPKIDKDRLKYAHREYTQNIEKFALFLNSSNPDHYKRAGALLHALYKAEVVTDLDLEASSDELKSGVTRVRLGDAEAVLPFVEFWEAYHNQALAFEIAYRCCASYEKDARPYSFDFLHNTCRYLFASPDLSIDSCFMLFKALME